MINRVATEALRARSPEVLHEALVRMLVGREQDWLADSRDLMTALAPVHDCARRLGLDPAAVFARAAEAGPDELADLVRGFGERTDVDEASFYYFCEDTPEGPEYWHDSPTLNLREVPREEREEVLRSWERELLRWAGEEDEPGGA